MSARLRFVQFQIEYADLYGPDHDEGVPLPPGCDGWTPIQVEMRTQTAVKELTLAVWLVKDEPVGSRQPRAKEQE